jgi:diphosphate-dependent phosphofructokinase
METSMLQKLRYEYKPKTPPILESSFSRISFRTAEAGATEAHADEVKQLFPRTYGESVVTLVEGENPDAEKQRRVGVILSGGQAPGGHNVIAGLLDGIKSANPASRLYGFRNGPGGILKDDWVELTPELVQEYRNTGGFDMIGSGRTKLETPEQFRQAADVFKKREIDAIVVIGGDDSNTNAALMAEYFEQHAIGVQVIGVPKTIDGDLKNEYIEISFGFDTAVKTYSGLIGNIGRDACSARKYWHFIKLMGRSASNIALECALQTNPNLCIISEEVAEKKISLDELIDDVVKTIVKRAENGDNFGIVLIPEGLIEFIPEMNVLIAELNAIMAENAGYFATLNTFEDQSEWINKKLGKDASYVFSSLPNEIQRQLLMDRDPHGNVQVSRIETEKLILDMVSTRLKEMKQDGRYQGSFSHQTHFLGYEGRCAFPSNFDADYCYTLGLTAFGLIANNCTGYIVSIRNLASPVSDWIAGGVPLSMMLTIETRHGKKKPVIRKALVDTAGKPYAEFVAKRDAWVTRTQYRYPGPIQYFGPSEIADIPNMTIQYEHGLL